eukprot:TRINITY_DN64475_c0_g1_i1.p1 TRINITY_DN64475_c0_g1~~TRINITY_DN64475_c0_g1_i1.p1  ORF type:complete len:190 (-),score=26.23 TRINITY_DN64475_c0_g1_i1:135-704(-)
MAWFRAAILCFNVQSVLAYRIRVEDEQQAGNMISPDDPELSVPRVGAFGFNGLQIDQQVSSESASTATLPLEADLQLTRRFRSSRQRDEYGQSQMVAPSALSLAMSSVSSLVESLQGIGKGSSNEVRDNTPEAPDAFSFVLEVLYSFTVVCLILGLLTFLCCCCLYCSADGRTEKVEDILDVDSDSDIC